MPICECCSFFLDVNPVKAAIDFVQVCGDHASLLSGRRRLAEVVAAMDTSKFLSQMHVACLELQTGIHCINDIITQEYACTVCLVESQLSRVHVPAAVLMNSVMYSVKSVSPAV